LSQIWQIIGTKNPNKTIDKEIVNKIDGNSTNKNKAKNVCYYEQKN